MTNLSPRQLEILELLRQEGSLGVESLAQCLGVTLQTLRHDARVLAAEGPLLRFHGGVRLPTATTANISYSQRQVLNDEAKRRIARGVAKAIPNDCSLILNIGATAKAIARALLQHKGLRVITNNLNVAGIRCDNADCEVIVASGAVRNADHGIVGDATIEFFRQFKVDICVIGISGVEADGISRDFDCDEIQVTRAILAHSCEVRLAAESTKFNRPAMVELGHIEQIDVLFTDNVPSPAFESLLAAAAVRSQCTRWGI